MQVRCGAWQVGNDIAGGRVDFVFLPTGPNPETSKRLRNDGTPWP
jgi:hypothetical protein